MSFLEGSNDGVISDSPSDVVSAPDAGLRRIVKTMIIFNADSAAVELNICFNNNGTNRFLWKGPLDVGETYEFGATGEIIVLDSPLKKIIAFITNPATTVGPDFTTSYADVGS